MNTKIGLGLAAIGRPEYLNVGRKKREVIDKKLFREEGLSFIQQAYERGIRYFDVAPGYGIAESMIMDWACMTSPKEVEVATKWGYTYVANLELNAAIHEVKTHTLQKLEEQWTASRELLPWLRVYQIHSASLETGVLESDPILDRLFDLKETYGLQIGLSTTGNNQKVVLERAKDIQRGGADLFSAFQVTFNVLDQSTAEVCNALANQGKKVIVKEALANGRLFPSNDYGHYQEIYQYLLKLGEEYGVGVDAIALRFCMQLLSPSVVLSGADKLAHLDANLKALDFSLSQDQLDRLKTFQIKPEAYWDERSRLTWS